MDVPLFITIGLMVMIAALTVGLWARSRSAKPVLGGVGSLLIPLGLYLTGLMRLAYNGVISIIDWAQRTVWDNTMSWGAGLVGAGVVMLVVSGLLKSKPRAPKAVKGNERAATAAPAPTPAVGTGKPAVTGAAKPAPAAKGKQAADPEDAEIEAILRKRGIM